MISREKFIEIMDLLRGQYDLDVANGEYLAQVFGVSESVMYDNGCLFRAVIGVLSEGFDREEVEHWVFERQFGKFWDNGGNVWREEVGVFWDRLRSESGKFEVKSEKNSLREVNELERAKFEACYKAHLERIKKGGANTEETI